MDEQKMQLVDWFDDLCVRFIINLPQEELESVERICFQIEEAQWFYEDFIRPLDPTLPSLPLRPFALQMFRHCPLLSAFDESQHIQAFDQFLAYKTRVPVRGVIMLNDAMDQVVLVRGWKKGANWSFPRGKINKDERDLDCAVREAYEETGYDLKEAGLVQDESAMKFIEVTMREQHMKLFVFRGVPMDTPFAPRTRKEISKISWYKLASLPGWRKKKQQQAQDDDEGVLGANKVYMVAPFLHNLKTWIALQRKNEKKTGQKVSHSHTLEAVQAELDDYITDEANPFALPQIGGQALTLPNLNALMEAEYHQPGYGALHDVDAAADLKRLLSVGQIDHLRAQTVSQPPVDTRAVDLLAMLQGGSQRAPQPQRPDPTPSAPIDQFDWRQAMASNNQHMDHFRADHNLPQPEHRHQAYIQDQPLHEGSVYPHTATDYEHHVGSPDQGLMRSQPTLQSLFGSASAHAPTARNGLPPPAPYHRIGDPDLARPSFSQTQHGPSIPAASELSSPKLSAQAQSLLDVFKTGRTLPRKEQSLGHDHIFEANSVSDHGHLQGRGIPYKSSQGHQTMGPPVLQQQSDSRARQALPDVSSPSVPSRPTEPASLPHPGPLMQQNSQQNSLLDLFRKPSQPNVHDASVASPPQRTVADLLSRPSVQKASTPRQSPTVTHNSALGTDLPASIQPTKLDHVSDIGIVAEPAKIPHLAPEPVELSANPSPGPGKKQIFDHKDGTMKDHVASPRILHHPEGSVRAPPAAQKSLTSATVTGPVKEPDFNATQRRNRQHRSDAFQSKASTEKPTSAPKHDTVRILKRPETPKSGESSEPIRSPRSTSERLSRTSPNRTFVKRQQTSPAPARSPRHGQRQTETPKPFTPRILRRPQVNDMPDLAIQPTIDAEQINKADATVAASAEDPKQSLLSLFRKPSATDAQAVEPVKEALTTQGNGPPKPEPTDPTLSGGHKQNLLSLFTKPSTPASATKPPQVSLPEVPRPASSQQSVTPINRSRFNSLASRDLAVSPFMSPISKQSGPLTATSSRRGSQTPISPSDRGFLLNYLDGFAKGVGQKK